MAQSPDFRESYANSVQVRVSVWDFQLVFGLASSESPDQVTDAQRDLTRIGIDRIAGMAGPPHEWRDEAPHLGSYPVADFEALAATWRDQPVDKTIATYPTTSGAVWPI